MKNLDFKPKLLGLLKGYSRKTFIADTMAGMTVSIVALPLAIAFGIASGVTPQAGIITAFIGGFIVSLMGGCSVQIAGPTGAFIVVIYGVIQNFGIQGLIVATFLAGVMLLLMGVLKMGTVIKFIPYPIVVGFTSGIAVTIFSTQIKDFFGLETPAIPAGFLSKWAIYFESIATINPLSVAVATATVLIIVFGRKLTKPIPASLVAIILMSVVAWVCRTYFNIDSIETIGDKFIIESTMPKPTPIAINMQTINLLLPSAFTIAFLGAVESLLSATVADGVTGDRTNTNTELIAQGAANIVVPFFGGIPVTGAIARTITNINSGGRTPVAGITNAVVLLLIFLCLSSLTSLIPMASLAGMLVVVAYNMSEWRSFLSLVKNRGSDVVVLLVTFFLSVLVDLTLAVEIGLLMAIFLFMTRVAATSNINVLKKHVTTDDESSMDNTHLVLPKWVEVYEIEGPFFFGVANKFDESMNMLGDNSKVRIIRMRYVPFIDQTGLHNLESLFSRSKKEGITIVLSGVNKNVLDTLNKSGLAEKIGKENICSNITAAIERSKEITSEL